MNDSLGFLDHVPLSHNVRARIMSNPLVFKLLAPLLFEIPYHPKTSCNAISLVSLFYHFRKTIIILIMQYVYRRHKETKRKYTRIDSYLDNLKRYRFKKAKRGYKGVFLMNI